MKKVLMAAAVAASLWGSTASAQEIVNGPRFDGMRPSGCIRVPMSDTLSVRDCLYPDTLMVMWSDSDANPVQLAVDAGDGWVFSQDGLDFLNLD